jgi:DNA-binding transcriptional LysR family regulator
VNALEAQAGVRLLLRTTRTVRITADGEQFLARARRIVAESDELGSMFSAPSALAGRVRVGTLVDSALSVRRLGVLPMGNYVSPS